ncbi:MAG: toprim domain-containing protein, partial [Candidatus Paceibacterales bacterium]
ANEKEIAKYINTPQTLLYDKSGIMYGLHNAKLAVRKQNQCVVTEGYTDVIMCHQAGYENTVAASGTALTGQHLTMLKRYSDNLVLAFDMDVAGDSATKRGINLAQEQGFNIKIIEHYGPSFAKASEGKEGKQKSDPAEIILKDPKIWQESIEKAKSIMDYYVDSAMAQFDAKTPEGKKQIGNIVLPAIKRLANKIEQSFWVQTLSRKLGIGEEAIMQELAKIKSDTHVRTAGESINVANNPQTAQVPDVKSRKTLLEEKVIGLILKNPEYIFLIDDAGYRLFSDKIKTFLAEIKKVVGEQIPLQERELAKDFNSIFDGRELNAELQNFIAAMTLKADVNYQEDGKDEMLLCLSELQKLESKSKQEDIGRSLEGETDEQKQQDLMKDFDKAAKKFHSLS